MCVTYFTMVPTIVNVISNKKKDFYSRFISDLMCVKCTTLTSSDEDDVRKSNKLVKYPLRSELSRTSIKKWKKSMSIKSQSQASALKTSKINEEEKSLLKFFAINALELSAPASDLLLKSRSSNWFQLSGHPDSITAAGNGTVWKKRSKEDDTEKNVYEDLSKDPLINSIVPKYYREVEYNGEQFIELQDLLHGFEDPYVIDIKMGTRTFLESEVSKSKARNDLYQKMISIDPNAPHLDEHTSQAVTKLRYMLFREQQSSSCSLGFRIEAMKLRGADPVTDLKKVKSVEDVQKTLSAFFNENYSVQEKISSRLKEMRSIIEQSDYFKSHEVIGSSIFMIYDNNKVGVWLIDFAKTMKLPSGTIVNHREKWVQGNHEEGLLFGFDKLIYILENLHTPLNDIHENQDLSPKSPNCS